MPNYYSSRASTSAPSESRGYRPGKLGPTSGGGGGGGAPAAPADQGPSYGKGSLNLLDLGGSAVQTVGSFAQLGASYVGGAAGAIGSVGFGDGKNIGALGDVPGNVLGAVGSVPLPYVGGDPTRKNATLGDVPGAVLTGLGLPEQALERTVAGQRVEAARAGVQITERARHYSGVTQQTVRDSLPPDLQQRLDAGESVNTIADELVRRGEGFVSNPIANAATGMILDPLNLIAPGVGKAYGAVKEASAAVRSADEFAKLNLPQRAAGLAYSTATRGLSAGGAAFMDRAIGPVTSGALHALGVGSYTRLTGAMGKLAPEYEQAAHDAAAVANPQLLNAVVADNLVDDVAAGVDKYGDVTTQIARRVTDRRAINPASLERDAQHLLERTKADFLGKSPEELSAFTHRAMAMVTGSSVEDAARAIGTASVKDAQTAHWLRYGKAITDFGEARRLATEALAGAKSNIDIGRLTLIGEDTLTKERALALADAAPGTLYDEAMRFDVLRNHFLGKQVSDGQIHEFVGKLLKEDALPEAVRMPKGGKNALPGPLSDFRAKWGNEGYDLGFAPKDGFKIIRDADGNVLFSRPFVPVVTAVDPVSVRNPLGRFVDSMTRGISQQTIVHQSRERMTDLVVNKAKLPISPNQVRSIHKAVMQEAASRALTPRALIAEHEGGVRVFDAIFKRFLSPDEYDQMLTHFDPTYAVMYAFEGNLNTVGWAQKLTGFLKRQPVGGGTIAKITEGLYPKARFTYRPTFQAQEMLESPILNAMRGIEKRNIDEGLKAAYRALAEVPGNEYLTEASYLNIAGDRMVQQYMGRNTPLGRALGRFANIQAAKHEQRVTQVLSEHGEQFRDAVRNINPKAWATMEEAYGTKDPRLIADAFLRERLNLSRGNLDDAMAEIDQHHDQFISAVQQTLEGGSEAIQSGRVVESQAANVAAGVAKGGTAASGGAVRAASAIPNDRVAEMVWQAFRESFRQSSEQAFATHFFRPTRGWLERSINHPYLGLYPVSYMWGKILPEFARFLVKRPFGVRAPGLGVEQLQRVQQAYVGALADDPEFRKWTEDNAQSIYFANILFPGNPVNLTANLPAPIRHIGQDLAKGKTPTVDSLAREAADTGAYALAGPVNDLVSFGNVATDLFTNLDRAAAQLDGMNRQ